jgi:hypothetical protein
MLYLLRPPMPCYVRFSNWPFEVKHFQTIRRCSVDVAHGLGLLFGIGTRPLYGTYLVKKFKEGSASFSFISFVSFAVRFAGLFLRPDPGFAHLAVPSATARLL